MTDSYYWKPSDFGWEVRYVQEEIAKEIRKKKVISLVKTTGEGDLVEFVYFGGTRYGQSRKTTINSVESDRLVCTDEGDTHPKQYLLDKIDSFKIVKSNQFGRELKALQEFLSKNPEYAETVLPKFNSRHGVLYELKQGQLVNQETAFTGVIRPNLGGGKEVIININGKENRFTCNGNYITFEGGYNPPQPCPWNNPTLFEFVKKVFGL